MWNTENQMLYNMTFQSTKEEKVNFQLFVPNLQNNAQGTVALEINNLIQNTTYIITVSAINEFGSSPPTKPVKATTKAFISEQI